MEDIRRERYARERTHIRAIVLSVLWMKAGIFRDASGDVEPRYP
jgi:hypothetical protein